MSDTPTMSEAERIERFENAYNRIDRALNEMLGEHPDQRRRSFARKVRHAAGRWRRFAKYSEFLEEIGELRNALVHHRTGDDLYLAVPSEKTVSELERIERRMFSPDRVMPAFQREVITLSPEDSLADAWRRTREADVLRFPVYAREGFVALLTSNGVARWIAQHARDGIIEIDASTVTISDVLASDHRRDHVAFVDRDARIDDVVELYRSNHQLEIVIITEHGKTHQAPLGLITPRDIAARE